MHQPDIDGERPLTIKNRVLKGYKNPESQSTEATLKPYDSAVKQILMILSPTCRGQGGMLALPLLQS